MLKLGPFVFSISTAAYQQLARKDVWRWQGVEVIGGPIQYQYMGPGERNITLTGVVFAHYDAGRAPFSRGVVGTHQMDALRGVGDMATPLLLTDGRGRCYGAWVVTDVNETASEFLDHGAPKKQEFSITMKHYAGSTGGTSLLGSLFSAFGGLFGGGSVGQVFASVTGMAAVGVGEIVNPGSEVLGGIAAAGIADPASAEASAGLSANQPIGG
jgi:phage protein U